ncbi:hypothetical protein B0I49_005444 [Clostridium beijerinckii]|nr:hypothetical protein [Clostridium beijerinckii]
MSELEKEVLVMNEELNKKKYTIKVLVGILSILLIGNLIMIIK